MMRILIAIVGTLLLCTAAATAQPTSKNAKEPPPECTPSEDCPPTCDPFSFFFGVGNCTQVPRPSRTPTKKKRHKAVPKSQ